MLPSAGDVWRFTRARLAQSLDGLDESAGNLSAFPGGHTIAEIVLHIAGAEHYWWARMAEVSAGHPEFDAKLDAAVIDGFLRDAPVPFEPDEITLANGIAKLEAMRPRIEALYFGASEEQLGIPMISPIGDPVDGREGLIRLAQHAGYHTGQIWQIRLLAGV